jgi:hypothetical protein
MPPETQTDERDQEMVSRSELLASEALLTAARQELEALTSKAKALLGDTLDFDAFSRDVRGTRDQLKALTAKVSASADISAKNTQLTADLEKARGQIEEQSGRLLAARREVLIKAHNIPAETIKDMDESQLSAIEAVFPNGRGLSLIGMDSGAGGAGTVTEKSPLQKIADGLRRREAAV